MSKRVYKFTGAQYGISNLEKKRLKLSTIKDLNDPFDLCPLNTTDPAVSKAADAVSSLFLEDDSYLVFQPELGQPAALESLRRFSYRHLSRLRHP